MKIWHLTITEQEVGYSSSAARRGPPEGSQYPECPYPGNNNCINFEEYVNDSVEYRYMIVVIVSRYRWGKEA